MRKMMKLLNDCEKYMRIYKENKKLEVTCFLSGKNDALDIYLEVHAGAEAPRVKIGLKC